MSMEGDLYERYTPMGLLFFFSVYMRISGAVCTLVDIVIKELESQVFLCYYSLWRPRFWGMYYLEGR